MSFPGFGFPPRQRWAFEDRWVISPWRTSWEIRIARTRSPELLTWHLVLAIYPREVQVMEETPLTNVMGGRKGHGSWPMSAPSRLLAVARSAAHVITFAPEYRAPTTVHGPTKSPVIEAVQTMASTAQPRRSPPPLPVPGRLLRNLQHHAFPNPAPSLQGGPPTLANTSEALTYHRLFYTP